MKLGGWITQRISINQKEECINLVVLHPGYKVLPILQAPQGQLVSFNPVVSSGQKSIIANVIEGPCMFGREDHNVISSRIWEAINHERNLKGEEPSVADPPPDNGSPLRVH